jgi:hypothetical protein
MPTKPSNNPECPAYNPNNCKRQYDIKVCAIVRRDKQCLKPKGKSGLEKPRPRNQRVQQRSRTDARAW